MVSINLFGFTIGRAKKDPTDGRTQAVAPQSPPDGAAEVASQIGSLTGVTMTTDTPAKNEFELINRYREAEMHPEADDAIDELVNEAVVTDDHAAPVDIRLDQVPIDDSIKKAVRACFDDVLRLMGFKKRGYDVFRRWYVDGRMYYQVIIDPKDPTEGIRELRYLDPRKTKKVRETNVKKDHRTGVDTFGKPVEYFIYTPSPLARPGVSAAAGQAGAVRIAADAIIYGHSGFTDRDGRTILGHLHKALKPLNQLRLLEDGTVIYILARAPQRRIFYIDTGNLPKPRAEQHLKDQMARFKNRIVYDPSTGVVKDDRKFMTLTEDIWLSRREGGKGTEIDVMPGGGELTGVDMIQFFLDKVYKALGVPIGRQKSDNLFSVGPSSQITRDEIKFSKRISRLRLQFTQILEEVLWRQLSLKGVMTREDWDQIREYVWYEWRKDNFYAEQKENEIMTARINLAMLSDPLVGKYMSRLNLRENILRQDEAAREEEDDQMSLEEALYGPPIPAGESPMDFDPDQAAAAKPPPKSRAN